MWPHCRLRPIRKVTIVVNHYPSDRLSIVPSLLSRLPVFAWGDLLAPWWTLSLLLGLWLQYSSPQVNVSHIGSCHSRSLLSAWSYYCCGYISSTGLRRSLTWSFRLSACMTSPPRAPLLDPATIAGLAPLKSDIGTTRGSGKMSNNRQNVTWVEVCSLYI